LISRDSDSQPVKASFHSIQYVFLDRDGVINRKPPEGAYISHWSGFHFLPGAESAIATLNRSGRRAIVVSNQRGIALGRYTSADVEALHGQLQEHLAAHGAHIDAFYYCPHDKDQCDCRKPGPGLFRQAFRDFPGASAANSLLIGDSLSDIQAAASLGMPSIFIQGDPLIQKEGAEKAACLADAVSASLLDAVEKNLPADANGRWG
jgi:D-glycero-D-manno-heptose 1,7-bisphosphate phosphatase